MANYETFTTTTKNENEWGIEADIAYAMFVAEWLGGPRPNAWFCQPVNVYRHFGESLQDFLNRICDAEREVRIYGNGAVISIGYTDDDDEEEKAWKPLVNLVLRDTEMFVEESYYAYDCFDSFMGY